MLSSDQQLGTDINSKGSDGLTYSTVVTVQTSLDLEFRILEVSTLCLRFRVLPSRSGVVWWW
jgi:hypothetical protein